MYVCVYVYVYMYTIDVHSLHICKQFLTFCCCSVDKQDKLEKSRLPAAPVVHCKFCFANRMYLVDGNLAANRERKGWKYNQEWPVLQCRRVCQCATIMTCSHIGEKKILVEIYQSNITITILDNLTHSSISYSTSHQPPGGLLLGLNCCMLAQRGAALGARLQLQQGCWTSLTV